MFSFDHEEWIEKHIVDILAAAATIIAAMTIACFAMVVQVMEANAVRGLENRELRILVNTHEDRIKELAAENAWVREKVRITVGGK